MEDDFREDPVCKAPYPYAEFEVSRFKYTLKTQQMFKVFFFWTDIAWELTVQLVGTFPSDHLPGTNSYQTNLWVLNLKM